MTPDKLEGARPRNAAHPPVARVFFEAIAESHLAAQHLKRTSNHIIPGYFDFHARIAQSADKWAAEPSLA